MDKYLHNSLSPIKEKEIINEGFITLPESLITNKTDLMVLRALLENQPSTRMDLCKKTGIPRTTIYDALTRLILKKLVTKYSSSNKSKGRPRIFYRVV
ncbi:MAG: helix-turn-helix domain-containing protein [Candidatus Hodarchaeales archaeon]|jgi:predicted transcriptional regulator